MQIKISPMAVSDLDEIATTLNTDFDDFWNYNIFKQELLNKNSSYIIAKSENGTIVGFAGFLTIFDEANITNIVVKKDFRNRGIGTLLLQSLINLALSKKLASVTLEVNEKNKFAISLYKKFGFELVGTRKKYYNGKDNALLMTLNINNNYHFPIQGK